MKEKILLLALSLIVAQNISAQITDSIPMSDGRSLAADVYIPSGMNQGPVILIQTPYNRLVYRVAGLPLMVGMNINSSNYIFVIADWRGFYGSASAAYNGNPSHGKDGFDCVEWIAQQSWCNQKIGTWGASALGRIQFMTAKENPPHLTCICPLVAGPQYDYVEYFPGGDLRTEYVEQLDGLGFGISPVLMMHPLHDIVWTISENANYYPDSINVPCFMIGGWYDHTIEFMLEFFNGLRSQSPLSVQNKHRLLMGPWTHKGIGRLAQGQLSYSNAENWSDSLALMFFDYHLRNISNGWDVSPFVQYYQMGENTRQTSTTWPPAGIVNTDFYFQSNGKLTDSPPSNSTDSLSFLYNPNDPSPTIGGPTLRVDLNEGPYNQADSVENRNDILIFTTDSMSHDVVMKGNATAHLKISSDKTDTDFDIRITDVYPDGRSMLVNDEATRMRFRNGNSAADTAAMIPGQVYDCVIKLPTTAITFLAGHRIRVDITSSIYPQFNRNMNTGGPMYPANSLDTLVNPVSSTNTVYTNSNQTSFIELPLVNYISNINEAENGNNGFNIYPNPFNNQLDIVMNEPGKYYMQILNLTGQVIYEKYFDKETEVNSGEMSNGIYLARITDLNINKIYFKKITRIGLNK